jgi:hypothetical protein
MGGKNERVVLRSPSSRFGRGFFSSINETVSTGVLIGEGSELCFDCAAAASAAARDFAAGVGATVVEVRALFAGASGLAAFAVDDPTDGLAVVLRAAAGAAGLRAVVFVVVDRVGMFLKIFLHGSSPLKEEPL